MSNIDEELKDLSKRQYTYEETLIKELDEQQDKINKVREYLRQEKENYLYKVQKSVGEWKDENGNVDANKVGLIISAAVNTCDTSLKILSVRSKENEKTIQKD